MTKGSWWSNKHRKYKYQDKKAGLEYNLTLDQAKALMSLPCFYCCRPEAKGLDRISNDFGHTTSNVVPCCGTCNLMLASTPWAAKIEMRESLRSIREKGLLGSWKPPYLTEPAKTVNVPLEEEAASESLKEPAVFIEQTLLEEIEEQIVTEIRESIDAETLAAMNAEAVKQQELEEVVVPTKEKIQEAFRRSAEQYSRRVPPSPPPRYDEVYHAGTAFLNSGEDCPPQPPSSTVPLTAEKVRELLEEGRECRKELFKRIRVMERLTPEMMNDKAKSASSSLDVLNPPLSREEWNKLIESDRKRTRAITIMGLDWPEDEEPIDPEGIQTC